MDRRFANDLDEASSRVLSMTERLLAMVDAGQLEKKGKGKEKDLVKGAPKAADKTRRKLEEEEDVIDGYKRGVLGVVDGLLEDSVSTLRAMRYHR
jgi:exosome complex exonuclease RRP6